MANDNFTLVIKTKEEIGNKLNEFGFTKYQYKTVTFDSTDFKPIHHYIIKCKNQEEVNYCKLVSGQ